uniref:Uncharacterized protein n=1 Tax=Homalodisca liturata TaxID=320908 RepID=A0A1B6K120_9HEMI
MPGRSPHRRSTPPPPLISRHSPSRGRISRPSPDRHRLEMVSTSRGRERREYRPSVRRSRSPVPSKVRSFSPPLKRKGSPNREREIPQRRTKISKSPVGSRGGSDHGTYIPAVTEPDTHSVRNVSESERFRERNYDGERDRAGPQFRGPEGSIDFDISELKKFTIEIIRKSTGSNDDTIINRTITNPDDIAPVRRPDVYAEDYHYYNKGHGKDEGARPLFLRAEASASGSKDRTAPVDEYRRIVAIDPSRVTGSHERERSRERPRYSPGPYEESRRTYYPERPRSPYESRHRSPVPVREREDYLEPREKPRERRASSREMLRRDVEVRRREERRYSPERGSYERDSDLRARINEKRSEPHVREEREHSSRRYENDKERHGRPHHSPVTRERRRTGSVERHEGSRPSRGEQWEREGGERRRRHSREREDRGRERYEHSDDYEERRPSSYKTDYEPKKFYRSYEEKEFVPLPTRGRGGPPMRRGVPPIMRGRGIVRGINRGFRGIMVPRGVPRVPFLGMRGFPPRKSTF